MELLSILSKMAFMCLLGGKCLKTTWEELETEFPEVYSKCTAVSLWIAARTQEPLSGTE
jgi:hypothetical protein